ncbi:hypothetical protein HHI36_012227 [Cryptolaemus montrouzieri]|uniref:Uncharacterized protein n=1 Tax=Cryptolaemus montrouzieri TaxID=559131 RepID=A0ABD2NE88_9CUCU
MLSIFLNCKNPSHDDSSRLPSMNVENECERLLKLRVIFRRVKIDQSSLLALLTPVIGTNSKKATAIVICGEFVMKNRECQFEDELNECYKMDT